MFSWRTVRTTCLVLLLIPVVHLVYLVSSDVVASLDPSPFAWQDEIDAYRQIDLEGKLPKNPIVVVGGMRVKLWQGLEDILAPRPVLMRGIGDAIIDDITQNHGQLIAYYRPEILIFLPSNSEFHIRDDKSAEDLAAGIKELVELDDSLESSGSVYIIAPLKTPLYPSDDARIEQSIELISTWAQKRPKVTVLDANPLLRGEKGRPNPAYFRADGINLNEHGYLRLSTLVQNQIDSTGIVRPIGSL